MGDPFKDTSSVALNPIIKFTTLFGLLAVELAVSLECGTGIGAGNSTGGPISCNSAGIRVAVVLSDAYQQRGTRAGPDGRSSPYAARNTRQMKKLINRPADIVDEMLRGAIAQYPNIARLAGYKVLLRAEADEIRDRQVALVSGGGSGHEPAHGGYVGAGMLSAAVAGEVFTSPPVSEVAAAIRAVTGSPGVLVIVKNYMGDRLNFGIAAEMARADGLSVETVIVADDVALLESGEPKSGRGLAGTVLVHKIAGGAAAAGLSLREVAAKAQAAADQLATMGLSLSAGTVPALGKPGYLLPEDEYEFGLGIHGEAGVRRTKLRPADELADQLIESILKARPLAAGTHLAVMINNLGATTGMEVSIFARRILENLQSRDLIAERVYSGPFMTSLEAAGISVSLLPVDDERLSLLDAPTSAPAWPNITPARPQNVVLAAEDVPRPDVSVKAAQTKTLASDGSVGQAVRRACQAIIDAEKKLTEMDQLVGDGDLGTNLARGARAIMEQLTTMPEEDAGSMLKRLGAIAQDVIGGSSGPLYGVLFLRAGTVLSERPNGWAQAVSEAVEAVSRLGGAKRGDRTMLDALIPFAEALQNSTPQQALKAAEAGAAQTAGIKARRGRSSYLGDRALGHEDPGAAAVVIWLRAAVG